MLEMQYGDLKDCPSIITGKVLEKEASIYTEETRQRLRYLCHLPLNSPFERAEIELKPPLVSTEIINIYHGDYISSFIKFSLKFILLSYYLFIIYLFI
jgi:hypothetical protein